MSDQYVTMGRAEWLLLLLLSMVWGATFIFVEIAIRELPPMTIVLARVFLAALLLLPVFYLKGFRLPQSFDQWLPFWMMGLLNNVIPFSLINTGQLHITAGMASILNATTPLCTVLVMAGFAEERLSWNRLVGVLLGVLGVAILSGVDAGDTTNQLVGIVLCLMATMSYALSALWGRRRMRGIPPLKSATCQLICSSLMMAVLVMLFEQPWRLQPPGLATWAALLGMASLSTALAYILFFTIMVRAGASNVMLVTLLIPISAVLLGYAFLGELVTWPKIAGALTIGLGLLFIDGRLLRGFRAG